MNLCSKNHDEICHEDRKCPVCVIIEDNERIVSEKDNTISDLNQQVENMKFEKEESNEGMESMSKQIRELTKDLELTRNGQKDLEQ